ncbi:MAG: hypothetical protein HGA45_04880 [Chloroflexales bacterium]|nr:hypothetical protein [Chloroflexales bacterium]
MFVGSRRIRSAGRTSGSVEVTLPPQLHSLLEIECRLLLRDGTHPEIILQPDLSVAHTMLLKLWSQLRMGLAVIGEIGDFDPGSFTLALLPPRHWQQRPPLAYADALVALNRGNSAESRDALARLVAHMGIVAGARLGLGEALAPAFGDTVAYLMTGVAPLAGLECERGLTQQIFQEHGPTEQPAASALDERIWAFVAPSLALAWEQFTDWQSRPESHAAARQQWYRALLLEMDSASLPLSETRRPDR